MIWDLIALGETMVSLTPPPEESWRSAAFVSLDHAGAESNTCVGLARLGLRAAWISRLGDDAAGDRILAALATEHVHTQWVQRDRSRPTGLMLKDRGKVAYYRSGSAASVMETEVLDPVPVADARAVLVTGVTALIGPGPHAAGLALLTRARGLRIVDPNLRQGLWGSPRRAELVGAFVEHCDLLLGGADELREVLGAGDVDGGEAIARQAAARGPKEVVVRGPSVVGALLDGVWRFADAERRHAVDPIGAGDAFNAGYIAARMRGSPVEAALRAGVRCGAAVTASPSDTSAFPRSLV